MTTYVGKLTYSNYGGPSTFLCISESKEELEKWALAKWNEMMPHKSFGTTELLQYINKIDQNSSWNVWERVEGEVQMHYLLNG